MYARAMRIGLITCVELPEPDPDAAILDEGLRAAGHEPVMVAWDDPSMDAAGARNLGLDVLALRSCWNYPERPDAFLAWVRMAHGVTRVVNDPEVVAWNVHKGYLLELAAGGVPVVATRVVGRGGETALPEDGEFDGGLVVKPAVGAGSVGARRFGAEEREEALAYLRALSAREDALVQPYMDGFREPGERALVWIDGSFSHTVRKRPRYAGEDESVEAGGPVTGEERAVGERAIGLAPGGGAELGYARVDVIEDAAGRVVVSELELIEPSLFFGFGPGSLEGYAGMLKRLAG